MKALLPLPQPIRFQAPLVKPLYSFFSVAYLQINSETAGIAFPR